MDDLTLEFHVYIRNELCGLMILECEFKTENDALRFEPPEEIKSFIVREITDEPGYKNKNLAVELEHKQPESS